jgi:hypothetical protein
MEQDWRLPGNEHLTGVKLRYKKYADRNTQTDHDHCEFCGQKFSNDIADSLTEGYTTTDDYHWICTQCFNDLHEQMRFEITSS